MKICILGAVFDTGNMGVSALAESSIKCILNRWPDCQITILGGQRESKQYHLNIDGREVCIPLLPLRYSKNIFLPNHFCVLFFLAFLIRIFPFQRFKDFLTVRNKYLSTIIEADLVVDITGGDSFSDIYGIYRVIYVILPKLLIIQFRKKLVMLPQTYGPFTRRITKTLAQYVLRHASIIYTRDKDGVESVKNLLGNNTREKKVHFLPDVAFILDQKAPSNPVIEILHKIRAANQIVIGLNISGLLFDERCRQGASFGLKTCYPDLINSIINHFLREEGVVILLVPHVFPFRGNEVGSDTYACQKIFESTHSKERHRILLLDGEYNHNEIKYMIGLCDFFVGSRMHACIAAMSQNVPAVGLAYSGKFLGVFDSLGMGDMVIDLKAEEESVILSRTKEAFINRNKITKELRTRLPVIQEKVLSLFQNIY